jgi:small subunit ribosomal protein S16
MLMIRLQRTGRKNEPTYRVILTEKARSPKTGEVIEILGAYDARRDVKEQVFKADRIVYWISKGAQPSDTMHNLLITLGIIKGKKVNALPRKSPIKKEGTEEAAPAVAAPAPEATAPEAETPTPAEAPVEAPATPAPEASAVEEKKESTPADVTPAPEATA